MAIALMFLAPAALALAAPPAGPEGPAGGRAAPDLAVRPGSFGFSPADASVGDEVRVNFTIENTGGEPAIDEFTVAFFLNDTSHPLKPGENNITFGGIDTGEAYNVSQDMGTGTLSAGITYTILIVVDLAGAILESDETNNTLSGELVLLPERLPDLSLSSLSLDPPSPFRGERVSINATVRNLGPGRARFFDVYFYADDIYHPVATRVTAGPINASGQANVTGDWDTTDYQPGSYLILVAANPDYGTGRIQETDWSNNNASLDALLAPSEANVELLALELDPGAPRRGDILTVNVTLKNIGTRKIVEVPVRLSLCETLLSNQSLNLTPGSSASVLTSFDTSPHAEGTYALRVTCGELDETRPLVLGPRRRPDLAPYDISISPDPAKIGQEVQVTVKVANHGEAASPACNVSLFVDSNFTAAAIAGLDSLQPSRTAEVVLVLNTSGLSAAVHRVRAQADSTYLVDEGNETNNSLITTLELFGEIDLALDNLLTSNLTPRVGDTVVFSLRLRNLGTVRCPSPDLILRVGNLTVDQKTLLPMAPGGTMDLSLRWATAGAAPGSYDFRIEAAPGENGSDADGSNDALGGTVQLLPPLPVPDLRVRAILLPPADVRVGESLTVVVVVENAGDGDAVSSTLMVFLEFGDSVLKFTESPSFVPAVPAGGTASVNITRDTQTFRFGTYRLNATADFDDRVKERDEFNNHLLKELRLLEAIPKRAVLKVAEVVLDGKLEEGSQLSIFVRVNNTGTADALEVNVSFQVDGKEIGRAVIPVVPRDGSSTTSHVWAPTAGPHSVRVAVSGEGSGTDSYLRTVKISPPPTENAAPLMVAGLGIVAILLTAVVIRVAREGRKPGPKVRLVEEEE